LRPLAERAERHPGFAAMAFIGLPGLEMVARREQVEAGLCRHLAGLDQLRHGELLVAEHEADQLLAVQCAIALLRAGGGGIGLAHRLRCGRSDPDIARCEQRAGGGEQLAPARGKPDRIGPADFAVHDKNSINRGQSRAGNAPRPPRSPPKFCCCQPNTAPARRVPLSRPG